FFLVKVATGAFPYPTIGPPGKELQGYIPDGVKWKQLNYGQREGQVEIDGREWGIYVESLSQNALAIALHSGEVRIEAALEFVQRVAEKTCGDRPFTIHLEGNDDLTD